MALIGIIPARGGSKRIPRKNIMSCAGRPLLAYTCEAALGSNRLSRVILSTDDPEIAEVGRAFGAECPFVRPAEFSADKTPMLPVLRHVLSWSQAEGIDVSAFVLLQPTSPLRTAKHISEAVDLFERENAESVVSVSDVPNAYHPRKLLRWDGRTLSPQTEAAGRPQGEPAKLFVRNGPAILITRPDVLARDQLYGNPNLPYFMSREDSVDIDTDYDFALAEWLLSRRASGARDFSTSKQSKPASLAVGRD